MTDETASPMTPLHTAMSAEVGKLALALSQAQSEMVNPPKDRTVSVQTRTGGSYEFKYATLDAVLNAIRGPLAKHQIAFTQAMAVHEKFKGPALTTMLIHSSGQWISAIAQLMVPENTSQALGSSVSYMRRYQISSLCGLCPDFDDDANACDGNIATDTTPGKRTAAPSSEKGFASRATRGLPTSPLVDPHFEASKREDWDNTPPPSALTLPPFGLYKGEPIHSVPLEGLEWYVQAVERSINDPAKGQYREKNEALLNALDAQIQHLNASSSGDSFEMAVQALRADEAVSQLLNDWGLLTMADVPIDRQSEFISMLKDLMKAQAKAKKKKPS